MNRQIYKYFFVIFILGVLARSYGITDHWKNNDHYNFGGTMMTHALKCLRETPFEISRGLIITECDTERPNIYVNYTPFFLYGMWATTEVFGEAEWAHRLFFLIFSSLNILLVFLIARQIWTSERMWLLAAFFQAFFLSPMYMGTHMDPITEFTLTPMLVSSLLTLRGRLGWAALWATIAGLTTWIGYFQFVPLILYSWGRRQNVAMVLSLTTVAFLVCIASLVFLRGTGDLSLFLKTKLTNPEYIQPTSLGEKLLLPLEFLRNFFQSLARLLGPLFAGFAIYELFWGNGRSIWRVSRKNLSQLAPNQWAFILTGFAFFAYLIPGHRYAMVHIHNYIFAIPMWALLCTEFTNRLFERRSFNKYLLGSLIIISLASYPYGIYQSRLWHDVLNSVSFILTALIFIYWCNRKTFTKSAVAMFLLVTALTNFSQVMNYRNEPDSEYPFCQWAHEEYKRTGQPIRTNARQTRTKEFLYCRGIPIIYEIPSI